MIYENDFLIRLKDFGLNSYEGKLWIALLSRGVSTAGELSDISTVPRSRTYDVLESLEGKGFITLKLGKPIKYVTVAPQEVLERIKKKVDLSTNKQLTILNNLQKSDVVKELNNLYSQGITNIDPSDLSGSLKGRSNLYAHLALKIKNAKKTVSIMTSEPGLIRKSEELLDSLKMAKKNKAKIRIIAPLNKKTRAYTDLLSCSELKSSSKINSRFIIVDNNEIVMLLTDDKTVHPSYDSAVWVNSPFFGNTLQNMFDDVWKNIK